MDASTLSQHLGQLIIGVESWLEHFPHIQVWCLEFQAEIIYGSDFKKSVYEGEERTPSKHPYRGFK